jgi:hypothetical protein
MRLQNLDYIKAEDEVSFARLAPRFDSRVDVAEQYHVVVKWLYSNASACTSSGRRPSVGLEHGDDVGTRITLNSIQFAGTWVEPIGEQVVTQVRHAVSTS